VWWWWWLLKQQRATATAVLLKLEAAKRGGGECNSGGRKRVAAAPRLRAVLLAACTFSASWFLCDSARAELDACSVRDVGAQRARKLLAAPWQRRAHACNQARHTRTRAHADTHTHTHVRTQTHTRTQPHTHTRTHTHTHTHPHTHTHTHTHIHTHTHTHARTHTHTHTQRARTRPTCCALTFGGAGGQRGQLHHPMHVVHDARLRHAALHHASDDVVLVRPRLVGLALLASVCRWHGSAAGTLGVV
jgi:hypothetical protein